jgi:hypothetical protein
MIGNMLMKGQHSPRKDIRKSWLRLRAETHWLMKQGWRSLVDPVLVGEAKESALVSALVFLNNHYRIGDLRYTEFIMLESEGP